MSVENSILDAIKRWGSTFKITNNGECYECKGFIEPLRYKNNMYLGGKRLDAGFFDGGHYLFIAEPKATLESHSRAVIECKNRKYAVKRAEEFIFRGKKLYLWAILKPYSAPVKGDYVNA